MKVVPKEVKNLNELENAIKSKEKVILVSNINLVSSLKKKVSKMSKRRKNTTKGIIGGITMIGAGALIGIFAPVATVGVMAGSVISAAGFYLTGGSAILKTLNALKGDLKNYTYMETQNKDVLILVKEHGDNAFDFDNDIINYDVL